MRASESPTGRLWVAVSSPFVAGEKHSYLHLHFFRERSQVVQKICGGRFYTRASFKQRNGESIAYVLVGLASSMSGHRPP